MDDKYVSKKEFRMFAVGAAGQGMIYAMMSSYISDFYINVLQVPLMFVLLLMLLARVWDAINDPLMGIIADRRAGKGKSIKTFIVWAVIPISILTILMFYCPDISSTGKMVYAAVVYVAWGMLYTMADVPFWSLPNVMTPNAQERGSVFSIGRTVNGVGSAIPMILLYIVNFILPKFMSSGSIKYEETKYFIMVLASVIIGGTLYTVSTRCIKERVVIPYHERKPGEPGKLARIFKCKPLMLVIAMGILSCGRYMIQAASLHVARYAFYIGKPLSEITLEQFNGDQTQLEAAINSAVNGSVTGIKLILDVCALVGMFGAMLLMPVLMKKFDYKKLVITTCLIGSAATLGTTLIGWFTQNLYACIPFMIISSFPLGVLNVICYAMIGDCLDYMELETGFRDNALGSACQGFVNKIGNAFATCGIVIVYILVKLPVEEMVNDTAIKAATELTTQQNFAMFSLVSIIPGVSLLLCIIPILFYSISGEKKTKMLQDLEKARLEKGIVIKK